MWGMKRKEIRDCLGSKIPVRVWIPINQPTNQPTNFSLPLEFTLLTIIQLDLGAKASPDNRGKTPQPGWVWLMGESALCAEIPQDVWESRQDQLLQGLPGLTHPRELCNLTAMSNTLYLPRCYTKMIDFTDAAAQPIWVVICTKMPLVQFKTEKNDQVVI